MNPGQAQRWIDRHFGHQKRYERTLADPPPEEEYISALDRVPHLLIGDEGEQTALELFLYAGCVRFGRWFAPSPPSVPHHYAEVFKRFAESLAAAERIVMNSPVFLVHSLRNDVYAEFGGLSLPLNAQQVSSLDTVARSLAAIPIPQNPTKQAEFVQAKTELQLVIDGLRHSTFRTFLRTALPYPLLRRPVRIALNWEGLAVAGTLTPEFAAPSGLLTQTLPPTALLPRTTTRWQYGRTVVEFEIAALVDPSIRVVPLQLPNVELPFEAWPNGLRVMFDLLYEVSWQLRTQPEFASIWVPAPGDLGDIESWCATPGNAQINYIRRAHPSMLYEAFVPNTVAITVQLKEPTASPWYMKCYALAEQYVSLGETREALFWLNVGVEALLKARMESHISRTGSTIDLEQLDGADAYWDAAKQLIAAQFPEIVDDIQWPQSDQKPSRFRQIKYFCRNVSGAPNAERALSNYSKVSKKRNKLFHGESESPVTIEDVRQAKEGFDWLLANFCP
jgi:hypothetical protein